MRLPPPLALFLAMLPSLLACGDNDDVDPETESAAPQDGAAAVSDGDASEAEGGAAFMDGGDGMDRLDASDRDAQGPTEDAARREDAEAGTLGPSADAGAPKPTLEELMQQYRAWSAYPSEPQAISAQIAALCRLPSAAETAFVASEHGMDYRLLQNWLNPAAKRGFDDKRTPFEVGAAIVKEKLVLESDGTRRLVARGLMIKRPLGFDPAHGDWEFGYWEPDQALRSGAEAARTCGGCHASSSTDFVFLDGRWRLPG